VNILLSCTGRRNYLVDYFRSALRGAGLVIAVDADRLAPALHAADVAIQVPPVASSEYWPTMLEICRRWEVRLLVSLNDYELLPLARRREQFAEVGTIVVTSDPAKIDICLDKWRTYSWLLATGLPTPRTYPTYESTAKALVAGVVELPLVVKPRWGSGSVGIQFVQTEDEVKQAFSVAERTGVPQALADQAERDGCRAIAQERVVGQEYGLDVVNDLVGCYRCTFVKKKLGMRSGETDRAETVDAPELESLGMKIGESLAHVGNLDCDVVYAPEGPVVLEMNPRFGGGYPFSHAAGANVPGALVAWAQGAEPPSDWLRVQPGVVAAKYSAVVVGPPKLSH
jgi:carbamoyl-phosphate synthase large subunit